MIPDRDMRYESCSPDVSYATICQILTMDEDMCVRSSDPHGKTLHCFNYMHSKFDESEVSQHKQQNSALKMRRCFCDASFFSQGFSAAAAGGFL